MSYYSDEQDAPRRHRSGRDRDSRRNRPVYEEEIIEKRRGPPRQETQIHRELVRRQDSDDIEEVQRDFPPGEGFYGRRGSQYPPRRARSDGRRDRDYDAYGGGRRSRGYDDRRGNRRRDYSSSSSSASPPPRRERRKSLGEQALAALGLGGAAGALAGNRSKSRDRSRDYRRGDRRSRRYESSSSRSRSRSRGGVDREKIMQAAKAAVLAGAAEAFRSRKEPGGWAGDKGKRVLTAAIGAGGIDGLVSGKDPEKKSVRHTAEAVIGGLIGNRVLNGARDKSGSRSRSRSRARSRDGGGKGGGLEGLAAGGLAAAAGKAFLDYRNRSKSRGRRSDDSSDDSRGPRRNKKRSKSVSDYVSQAKAAIGLKDDKGGRDDRRSRGYDGGYDDRYSQGGPGRLRGGGGEGGDGVDSNDDNSGSDTSDISSSEEERRTKKMRGKEWITAGLASVATIHAGHSVYQSIENRKKRRKEVAEGKMSPEEARKKKNKARLQDAASVGIAALGIKGAISEWKEMKEQRDEVREFKHKCEERHQKKLQRSQESSAYGGSNDGYPASEPNIYQGNYYPDTGPVYQDGNPYHTGGLPPPPMAPPHARY